MKTLKISPVKTFVVIISLLIIQFSAKAQITLESSDMPSQGDTVRISTGLNLDFTDYTETGENLNWDFSQLQAAYQTVDTFVSPTQTPPLYQFFFALSSNLANRYLRDLPIPNFELTDIYYFYKNSNSKFTNTGYAASINGIPLPVKYDNPDVLYRFPLNYGDRDSCASRVEYDIPGMGYLLVDRTRKNTVDGWGTVTTPFGAFEVLRVKSEVHEFDSIYIDSIQMGIPLDRNFTEYKWLAKDQKEPVLQITDDFTGGLVVIYRDSARAIFDAVNENYFNQQTLTVYPNPVSRQMHVTFNLKKSANIELLLMDMTGRKIYEVTINKAAKGVNKHTVDLQKLNLINGTYLLEIRAGKQHAATKIIIRK